MTVAIQKNALITAIAALGVVLIIQSSETGLTAQQRVQGQLTAHQLTAQPTQPD